MSKRLPTTIRFSPEAKRLLRALAQHDGVAMTAVLEVLIRAEAKKKRLA